MRSVSCNTNCRCGLLTLDANRKRTLSLSLSRAVRRGVALARTYPETLSCNQRASGLDAVLTAGNMLAVTCCHHDKLLTLCHAETVCLNTPRMENRTPWFSNQGSISHASCRFTNDRFTKLLHQYDASLVPVRRPCIPPPCEKALP